MFKLARTLVLQFLNGAKMSKTETLNLRVSAEFKKRLVEAAAREKRSVTNYLEATLSAIWEQKDDGEEKGKGKRS